MQADHASDVESGDADASLRRAQGMEVRRSLRDTGSTPLVQHGEMLFERDGGGRRSWFRRGSGRRSSGRTGLPAEEAVRLPEEVEVENRLAGR